MTRQEQMMSTTYRATLQVTAPAALTNHGDLTAWIEDIYATMAAKVNRHMILTASKWWDTGVGNVYGLTFTYTAGQDVEAAAIIHDAAREAGASYDSVSVTRRGVPVPA